MQLLASCRWHPEAVVCGVRHQVNMSRVHGTTITDVQCSHSVILHNEEAGSMLVMALLGSSSFMTLSRHKILLGRSVKAYKPAC